MALLQQLRVAFATDPDQIQAFAGHEIVLWKPEDDIYQHLSEVFSNMGRPTSVQLSSLMRALAKGGPVVQVHADHWFRRKCPDYLKRHPVPAESPPPQARADNAAQENMLEDVRNNVEDVLLLCKQLVARAEPERVVP